MADTSLLFNVLAKDKASAVLSKVGGAAKALGIAAAAGIGLLAKQSVDAARDLNETQSKVGVLFGKSKADVMQFAAQAATSMGQSKQAVLDGASTFAVYGKGAGMAGKDLVRFSTGLTGLASDMASFSNTSPEEAIQAIGAAMRGESDPIEKYGVLLNENVIKARALKEGIISATKDALTPQQRVLAVQAELFAQTRDAQGDFTRTSGGLANQQRILTAQWANFKTTIGQALLPVMTQFVTLLNTRLMPELNRLWSVHGPQITAFLADAASGMGDWIDKVKGVDFGAMFARGKDALADLGPAMAEVRSNGPAFADTLRVGGEVMGFLADHSDLLAKALPYLAVGFMLVKTAQVASNVAMAISPALKIAEMIATRRLAASNAQLTAAIMAQTGAARAQAATTGVATVATTAGDAAQKRSIISMVASKVAMVATTAATKTWAAAQWLLNAALIANPIGLTIALVALLVAGIVLAYKKSETFRMFFNAAFSSASLAVLKMVDMFLVGIRKMADVMSKVPGPIGRAWQQIGRGIDAARAKVDQFGRAIARATRPPPVVVVAADVRRASASVRSLHNQLVAITNRQYTAVLTGRLDYFGNRIPGRAGGGRVEAGMPYVVGERRAELFVPDTPGTILPEVPTSRSFMPLAGGGGEPARVTVEFTGDDTLLRWIRNTVRVKGRGNVQVAFGQGRGV